MRCTRPLAIVSATLALLGASAACLAQSAAAGAGSPASAAADLRIEPRITPLLQTAAKSAGGDVFEVAALPRVPGPTTITHLHRNAAGELLAVCTVQHAPPADPHGATQRQEQQR